MSRSLSARDIAMIAMGVALTAVCSWISIPLTVPFTMQTFAIFLACGLLPTKTALLSVFAYIILGAAGVPVFSGFRGGAGVLLSDTSPQGVAEAVRRTMNDELALARLKKGRAERLAAFSPEKVKSRLDADMKEIVRLWQA